MSWNRVSPQNPCRICGKPDWCTYTDTVACCMRVQSGRPAKNGGWIHDESGTPVLTRRHAPVPPPQPPSIDAPSMMARWRRDTSSHAVATHADQLGVSRASMYALDVAWAAEHRAWAWPMCDSNGQVVGIRLRNADGYKWSVRGSRQGVFLPRVPVQDHALITEGPTDTAAAVSLGFFALGRPSCSTGGVILAATCRRLGIRRVIMVTDNDQPGIQGSERVAQDIGLPFVAWLPPYPWKDIREFASQGGTRDEVLAAVRSRIWRMPDELDQSRVLYA